MNPLLLLNWRLWAAAAIAITLAASHWKAYTAGKAGIRAEWNAERLEQANQSRKLLEKSAAETAELQAQAEQIQGAKNAQIQALNSRVAALNTELRNRPQRPSGTGVPANPPTGGTASGCTGAGLFGEDAEFSLGEAATAQTLRIHLKTCYARYNAVRSKFEALTKKE